MPQIRVQTQDLNDPPAYQVQQVTPDTFARPRVNAGAGKNLTDLAQALQGIRPEVGQFLGAAYDKYNEDQSALGIQDYREMLKSGAIASGDFRNQQKGWSPARVQSFEMLHAQDTASDYSFALHSALNDLLKQDNPNPQDALKTVQTLRDQYAQQGNGSGAIWQKAFGQYAHAHESDALAEFQNRAESLRETHAVELTARHAAVELTALAANGDPEAIKAWQKNYFDASFHHSPLSGDQQTQALASGFGYAINTAASNGKFDTADHLLAMMRTAETAPGQLFSNTKAGKAAMEQAIYDIYREKQNQNANGPTVHQREVADARTALWAAIKNNSALPAEKRSTVPPDALVDSFVRLGIDPSEPLQQWKLWNDQPRKQAKDETKDAVDSRNAAINQLEISYRASHKTKTDFDSWQQAVLSLAHPEDGPQASQAVREAMREVDKERANFTDEGLLKNDIYKDGAGSLKATVQRYNTLLNAAAKGHANPLFGKTLSEAIGVTADLDEVGDKKLAMSQAEQEATSMYLSKMHDLTANGIDNIDLKARDAALKDSQDYVKQRYEEIIKRAEDATTKGDENTTPPPPQLISNEGVPTQAMVRQVLNDRQFEEDVTASTGMKFANILTGGGSALVYGVYRHYLEQVPVSSDMPTGTTLKQLRGQEPGTPYAAAVNREFQGLTETLLKSEKDNTQLFNRVTQSGLNSVQGGITDRFLNDALPFVSRSDRRAIVDWAESRDRWNNIVNARGLTPEELAKVPKEWVTSPTHAFPTIPIFTSEEEMTEEAVKKIQTQFGLSDDERRVFYAYQKGAIEQQRRRESVVTQPARPLVPGLAGKYGIRR